MITRGLTRQLAAGALGASLTASALGAGGFFHRNDDGAFRRIASFPVFLNTDVDAETVAEIVAATDDGELLVYTDSETENVGFVDISNPYSPAAAGLVAVGGEPTSVSVVGDYALVGVNTSDDDFVNTSGLLQVIDIETRDIVRTIMLGGQPDSVDVSPNGRYAAIAIENERDEDLGDGEPPQLPAGFLAIVDLVGPPAAWSLRTVELTGIADLFPEDPEPEFVDINAANVAAVTLQENNHVVLVWLPLGIVIGDFSCGTVDLEQIDTVENDLIQQSSSLTAVPREPDAVAWTSLFTLATADEGDLFGGSRGFTIFGFTGDVLYGSGNDLELLTARLGHYPEDRSENKGNEPESVAFATYGGYSPYLFVGSERSSLIFVYRMPGLIGLVLGVEPELMQVLPAGVAPEGVLPLPQRDLLVVANEDDARDDKIRSTIMIYERNDDPAYPTIESADRPDGTPIPWGALSGLAAAPNDADMAYTVYDSFYERSRFFGLNVGQSPAVIESETMLRDDNGVLAALLQSIKDQLPGTDDFDLDALINDDGSVNLDPEGIAVRDGRGWIASEGSGNLVDGVSDPEDRPFESPNLVLEVEMDGTITDAISLPIEVTRNQFRFGFEGVTVAGPASDRRIVVAMQRAWQNAGDVADQARIAVYRESTGEWQFAAYPLDAPTSPNGGWVGLSDITHLGGGVFAVLERDNQGGPDATIKRIYTVAITNADLQGNDAAGSFTVLEKTLVRDLIAEGDLPAGGGLVLEKLEGLSVQADGRVLVVNDNDGVDDNSGETQLIDLGELFD